MGYPLVSLVSGPHVDAEVRCNLNEGTSWPVHDAFSLGAPPLLGDPGGIGAEYGFRTLSFTLVIDDGEARALQKQSELAHELLREENYLLFQFSASAPPVWFRCVRSSPGEVSLATVFRDREKNRWRVAVSLQAYPFAMGERITHTFTVGNDPATGGLSVVLPDIVGDAPAPLVVDVAAGDSAYMRPFLSVMPLDGSWPDGAVSWQAETWLTSTGPGSISLAAAAATDASSGQVMRWTYSDDLSVSRRALTGMVTVPFAGRWRLFVRTKLTPGGAGSPSPATVAGSGANVSAPTATLLDAGPSVGVWLVDLGIFTFPKGNVPSSKPYTLAPAEVGIDVVSATGPSIGSANLDFDYIVAVPVDLPLDQAAPATTLDFQNDATTAGDAVLRLDAETGRVQEIRDGAYDTSGPEQPCGSFLKVVPRSANVLTLMTRRKTGLALLDDITDDTTLTVSYHPLSTYLASP